MVKFDYFQKSLAFIAPLLALHVSNFPKPVNSYLQIKDFEFKYTNPLIVIYDSTIADFETKLGLLRNHPRYENDFELSNNQHMVVFDIGNLSDDVECIINGNYSKLSEHSQNVIRAMVPENPLIVMSLNPKEHRKTVADLLEVDPSSLPDELLAPPKMDTDGEILILPVSDLEDLKLLYK